MSGGQFKATTEQEWVNDLIEKNTGIEDKHVEFILWVEQYFMLHSRLPTLEESSDSITINQIQWQEYWRNNAVRNCLMTRGVPLRHPEPLKQEELDKLPDAVLSARQLSCINSLLDVNDTSPDHMKLKKLGIRTSEYQKWRADPVFLEYYQKRAKKFIVDLDDDAYRAFGDNIRDGDMSAIKMYFEMKGIYRSNDPQIVQFRVLVQGMIDVIQQEIKDPESLTRISNKILALISEGTTALPPAIDKSISSNTRPVGLLETTVDF